MEELIKWFWRIEGTLVFIIIIMITSQVHDTNEKDLACQRLGVDDYEYKNELAFCEDENYNLHYIHMECKPWYWSDCTATPISVGDVRVV